MRGPGITSTAAPLPVVPGPLFRVARFPTSQGDATGRLPVVTLGVGPIPNIECSSSEDPSSGDRPTSSEIR